MQQWHSRRNASALKMKALGDTLPAGVTDSMFNV
jgi:hypothetical protein